MEIYFFNKKRLHVIAYHEDFKPEGKASQKGVP